MQFAFFYPNDIQKFFWKTVKNLEITPNSEGASCSLRYYDVMHTKTDMWFTTKKREYHFYSSVLRLKMQHFHTNLPCQKSNWISSTKWAYHKEWTFATAYLIFLKIKVFWVQIPLINSWFTIRIAQIHIIILFVTASALFVFSLRVSLIVNQHEVFFYVHRYLQFVVHVFLHFFSLSRLSFSTFIVNFLDCWCRSSSWLI